MFAIKDFTSTFRREKFPNNLFYVFTKSILILLLRYSAFEIGHIYYDKD